MARDGRPDPAFWLGRSVFVTGHTGFVGGWLALWLARMGAKVHGYSLQPPTIPNFFDAVQLGALITSNLGDLRAKDLLHAAIAAAKPDILFHLAAQPLIGVSFVDPLETFSVNTLGTMNVLGAITDTPILRGAVIVTTDKVYAESNEPRRHREDDALGGHSPYSLSKAGAEFAVAAYRQSKLMRSDLGLATARAGNIIGGGDWAQDRLVPDAVRAFTAGAPLMLRMPGAIRPWQYVLDAVSGLLLLGERTYSDPAIASGAWNFGPSSQTTHTVEDIAKQFAKLWGGSAYISGPDRTILESPHLQIDSGKATAILGWKPYWTLDANLQETAQWYQTFYRAADMRAFSIAQLDLSGHAQA